MAERRPAPMRSAAHETSDGFMGCGCFGRSLVGSEVVDACARARCKEVQRTMYLSLKDKTQSPLTTMDQPVADLHR